MTPATAKTSAAAWLWQPGRCEATRDEHRWTQIACDQVIVDAKVIDRITDVERGQMLNYLRITKLRVGLILNFKHPRLEWERILL